MKKTTPYNALLHTIENLFRFFGLVTIYVILSLLVVLFFGGTWDNYSFTKEINLSIFALGGTIFLEIVMRKGLAQPFHYGLYFFLGCIYLATVIFFFGFIFDMTRLCIYGCIPNTEAIAKDQLFVIKEKVFVLLMFVYVSLRQIVHKSQD